MEAILTPRLPTYVELTFPLLNKRKVEAVVKWCRSKQFLVELEGFEPSTSSMPLKRSPN